MDRSLVGHPQSVKLGSGDNKTRLYTLQFAGRVLRFGGMVSTSVQRSNAHVLRELVGERSRRNGFSSSERVRLLQLLLLHPQEGWWSKTHSRFQTSESRPYETAVQDDYVEADPLVNMPRGLVLFVRSERPFHIRIAPHHRQFLRFTFE